MLAERFVSAKNQVGVSVLKTLEKNRKGGTFWCPLSYLQVWKIF